jgi:hypothetical protein
MEMRSSGPVPVLNGDLSIDESKNVLGKLSVAAAAETVIANFIYDPICDYGHSVRILRNVLRAWTELELSRRI